MTEIKKHAEFEDTYDDADHPIPSLTHLDVCGVKKGGGADLVIVIAKPLMNDEYSLKRLLKKIEGYLVHLHSDAFMEQAGAPSPDKTTIRVRIHPDSSAEAFDLLERSNVWVRENNASLVVEPLEAE